MPRRGSNVRPCHDDIMKSGDVIRILSLVISQSRFGTNSVVARKCRLVLFCFTLDISFTLRLKSRCACQCVGGHCRCRADGGESPSVRLVVALIGKPTHSFASICVLCMGPQLLRCTPLGAHVQESAAHLVRCVVVPAVLVSLPVLPTTLDT